MSYLTTGFTAVDAAPVTIGDMLTRTGIMLSVVVPVKDEQGMIAPFVDRMVPLLERVCAGRTWEILFVDDGSSDATLADIAIARSTRPNIRALSLSRNFGKEAALSAGLDHAVGDAIVPMDVDLQDPPEIIADMVEKWRAGYEVVYGVRRCRKNDNLLKRTTAGWFYRAYNALTRERIPEDAGDFRLLDRKVVDVVRRMPERNRFMKGLFAWGGFRQTSIEYDRAERAAGTTKFNYWKLWTLALDGITSSSTAPLRIWSYIGAAIAAIALAYAAFIIVNTILFGSPVQGYPSVLVSLLFLGGVQLISLGILGEYVGRVLVETKQRPLYIVREHLGFDGK